MSCTKTGFTPGALVPSGSKRGDGARVQTSDGP